MVGAYITVTLLGLILGSFLNALIFRYNTGRSVGKGRSKCMHCGHTLGWLDLIPVFSFVLLRGRCRYCESKISWQYPLVELTAALLALGVFMNYADPLWFGLGLVVWMTLLFIAVYDLRHQVIPLEASLMLIVLTLGMLYLSHAPALAYLAGPILASPLLLISLVSQGRWMGWGDGILELPLGLLLGLTAGLTAFVLAFWSGALVALGLLAYTRYTAQGKGKRKERYTMKSEVPFAPFLIVGVACAYFLHVDFFQTLTTLF